MSIRPSIHLSVHLIFTEYLLCPVTVEHGEDRAYTLMRETGNLHNFRAVRATKENQEMWQRTMRMGRSGKASLERWPTERQPCAHLGREYFKHIQRLHSAPPLEIHTFVTTVVFLLGIRGLFFGGGGKKQQQVRAVSCGFLLPQEATLMSGEWGPVGPGDFHMILQNDKGRVKSCTSFSSNNKFLSGNNLHLRASILREFLKYHLYLCLGSMILSTHGLKVKRLHLFSVTVWEARNLAGPHACSWSYTQSVTAWQSQPVSLEQTLELPRQNTTLTINLGNETDTNRPPSPRGAYIYLESTCVFCLLGTHNLPLVRALWCSLWPILPPGVGMWLRLHNYSIIVPWPHWLVRHIHWSNKTWVPGLLLEQPGKKYSPGMEVSRR